MRDFLHDYGTVDTYVFLPNIFILIQAMRRSAALHSAYTRRRHLVPMDTVHKLHDLSDFVRIFSISTTLFFWQIFHDFSMIVGTRQMWSISLLVAPMRNICWPWNYYIQGMLLCSSTVPYTFSIPVGTYETISLE